MRGFTCSGCAGPATGHLPNVRQERSAKADITWSLPRFQSPGLGVRVAETYRNVPGLTL